MAGVCLVTVAVRAVLVVVMVTVAALAPAIPVINASSPSTARDSPEGTSVGEGTWVVTELWVIMVAVGVAEAVVSVVEGITVVVVGTEAGSVGIGSP